MPISNLGGHYDIEEEGDEKPDLRLGQDPVLYCCAGITSVMNSFLGKTKVEQEDLNAKC